MQKYVGSKIVAAEPMTRLEYNQYRGWELPADENGTDDGYLVEYMDGGKSNHPNHSGYISWSPKEQFDKGYDSIVEVVKNPQPHVLRMQGEYTQLRARMKSLMTFQKTSMHQSLSTHDQELLSLQLNQMSQYADTLRSRILQYV